MTRENSVRYLKEVTIILKTLEEINYKSLLRILLFHGLWRFPRNDRLRPRKKKKKTVHWVSSPRGYSWVRSSWSKSKHWKFPKYDWVQIGTNLSLISRFHSWSSVQSETQICITTHTFHGFQSSGFLFWFWEVGRVTPKRDEVEYSDLDHLLPRSTSTCKLIKFLRIWTNVLVRFGSHICSPRGLYRR